MGRQGPHPQLDARVAVQPRFGRRHDRLFAGGELAQGGRHLPAGLVFARHRSAPEERTAAVVPGWASPDSTSSLVVGEAAFAAANVSPRSLVGRSASSTSTAGRCSAADATAWPVWWARSRRTGRPRHQGAFQAPRRPPHGDWRARASQRWPGFLPIVLLVRETPGTSLARGRRPDRAAPGTLANPRRGRGLRRQGATSPHPLPPSPDLSTEVRGNSTNGIQRRSGSLREGC
jgi:hypothetical protein